MKLEKSIILHATDEAEKKWESKGRPAKKRRASCPSCEIENIRKEAMLYKEEIPDNLLDNDYINKENDKSKE
jgi:NAD-dependent SIR2 family protein deacetylase